VIEAVLLDVGGVLITPDHDVIRPPIETAGGSGTEEALDRGHYAGIAAIDAVGQLDWMRYLEAVTIECGVPSECRRRVVEELAILLHGAAIWRRVVPGARDGLEQLASTGVAIAIVSNSDGTVEQELINAGLCQIGEGAGIPVTVIIDSHVVGYEKPDARIFQLALDKLGVTPDRAVHVGDTAFADVDGARAAGVRPLHLDPYGLCPRRPGDHEHVRSLAEVAALVGSWRPGQ
jgi:putative hydrolase of the HAD superfamily